MDFREFDIRRYPTLPVLDGYREWAGHYESSVYDAMDLRLRAGSRAIGAGLPLPTVQRTGPHGSVDLGACPYAAERPSYGPRRADSATSSSTRKPR